MTVVRNDVGFKWGVIGPGQIARDFIHDMSLVTEFANTIVAVLSNRLTEAQDFSHEYGVPYAFDQAEQMLREAKPDIVYVATPHPMHHDYTVRCLEKGVAVVCEKPLALNAGQSMQMIGAARDTGAFLLEGMWIRYLPSIRRVLTLLEEEKIGKIQSVTANMSYRAPRNKNNRFYNPDLGGGSLLDLGIYPVYLAVLLLGEPDRIQATALLSPKGIDTSCAVTLVYEAKRAYALAESSITKETDKTAVIWGEKGKITILAPWNERSEGVALTRYDGKTEYYPCAWEGRGFQYEITEALRCISEGKIESDLHDHQESLVLMRVLDEIRRQTGISYPMEEGSSGA